MICWTEYEFLWLDFSSVENKLNLKMEKWTDHWQFNVIWCSIFKHYVSMFFMRLHCLHGRQDDSQIHQPDSVTTCCDQNLEGFVIFKVKTIKWFFFIKKKHLSLNEVVKLLWINSQYRIHLFYYSIQYVCATMREQLHWLNKDERNSSKISRSINPSTVLLQSIYQNTSFQSPVYWVVEIFDQLVSERCSCQEQKLLRSNLKAFSGLVPGLSGLVPGFSGLVPGLGTLSPCST